MHSTNPRKARTIRVPAPFVARFALLTAAEAKWLAEWEGMAPRPSWLDRGLLWIAFQIQRATMPYLPWGVAR